MAPSGPGAVLGIDPALDGALAWIDPEGMEAVVAPTLATGRRGRRRHEAAAMSDLVAARPVELVAVEAVGPMPGRGVASTFGFGLGYGPWLGLLAALKVPHQAVTPQAWKQAILAGTTKTESDAITLASRRFPAVPPPATPRSRVPHDGIADAPCPAEFARRLGVGAAVPTRWAVSER